MKRMMLVANNHNSSEAESCETDNERSNSKTTIVFITEPFYRIDDEMKGIPKQPQALLIFSEIVTLGFLFALKGGGSRAFYRWLEGDYLPLLTNLPESTPRQLQCLQTWLLHPSHQKTRPLRRRNHLPLKPGR